MPDDGHISGVRFEDFTDEYARYRPGYSPPLGDYLVYLGYLVDDAAPGRDSIIVDIGAGTGKSAIPLAERGYRVVALDLGERRLPAGGEIERDLGRMLERTGGPIDLEHTAEVWIAAATGERK